MGLPSSAPTTTLTQLTMGSKEIEKLPAPAAAPAEPTRGRRNRYALLLGVVVLAGLRLFAWSREGQGWMQVRSKCSNPSDCADEPDARRSSTLARRSSGTLAPTTRPRSAPS